MFSVKKKQLISSVHRKEFFWNGSHAIPLLIAFFKQNYHTIEMQAWPYICQFSIFLFVKNKFAFV